MAGQTAVLTVGLLLTIGSLLFFLFTDPEQFEHPNSVGLKVVGLLVIGIGMIVLARRGL